MRRIPLGRRLPSLLLIGALVACDPDEPPPPDAPVDDPVEVPTGLSQEQEAFWAHLQELCGQAFSGVTTRESGLEVSYQDASLVMHVRRCLDDEIQIPLHVNDDRSRTWIVTREDTGLRLKHDHRHEDGTEEEITWYGGDTEEPGMAGEQRFHADAHTADLIPEAATNVWTMEVTPGELFAYHLVREGTDREVRWEFDLTDPVEPPPAPWGWEDTEPTH